MAKLPRFTQLVINSESEHNWSTLYALSVNGEIWGRPLAGQDRGKWFKLSEDGYTFLEGD